MRIIRPGVLRNPLIRFECGYCGCEWEEEMDLCAYQSRLLLPSNFQGKCPTCNRHCVAPVPTDAPLPESKYENKSGQVGQECPK